MGERLSNNVLDHYHRISNKLKKRFLRKPNVTEACESFSALAKDCESNDMHEYAGMCWIAVARCKGSVGNLPAEVSCLSKSAEQFLECERKNLYLGNASPSGGNIQAVISCRAHATSRLPENSSLGILSNMQMAEAMEDLGQSDCSEVYLRNVLESFPNSLETRVVCMKKLGQLHINNGDFSSALEKFASLYRILEQTQLNASKKDDLIECELTCLFLLLILKPCSQNLSPDLGKLLEKYTWGESNDVLGKNLFILLQSLVLTCQSTDTSCLPQLEAELWLFLNTHQRDLLHTLVVTY